MMMKWMGMAYLIGAAVMGAVNVSAAGKAAPEMTLTADGEKLLARYADRLKALQTEIGKTVPNVSEQNKTEFQKTREAVKKALAEADAAQKPLNTIQTAKALVEHAKGKWIGGAEKGIAQAEAALKMAATEPEREAAKKELAKWQADKDAGIKALKERQEALDKAKTDEAKLTQANQDAQKTLVQAQANEVAAAKVLLTAAGSFLSGDKLDAERLGGQSRRGL